MGARDDLVEKVHTLKALLVAARNDMVEVMRERSETSNFAKAEVNFDQPLIPNLQLL